MGTWCFVYILVLMIASTSPKVNSYQTDTYKPQDTDTKLLAGILEYLKSIKTSANDATETSDTTTKASDEAPKTSDANSKTSEVTPQTNDVTSQTSDVTTTTINTDDVGEKKQWGVQDYECSEWPCHGECVITGGYKDDKRLTDIVYKLCICHDGIVRKNKPGCLDVGQQGSSGVAACVRGQCARFQ